MLNLGAFLDVLLVVLLAGIGGLLVLLHVRLREFLGMQKQMPVLGEALSANLIQARATLAQLSSALQNQGLTLETNLKKAENTLQDLDFVLHRADKILGGLDTRLERAQMLEEKEKNFSFEPKLFLAEKQEDSKTEAPVPSPRPSASVTPLRARVEEKAEPKPVARPTAVPTRPSVQVHQKMVEAQKKAGRRLPSDAEERLRKALKLALGEQRS